MLVRTSYTSLSRSAGLVVVERRDRTPEYRAVQRAWIDATVRRADEVVEAMGEQAAEQRIAERRASLAAIDAGVLERWEYLVRRPPAG